jgi:hypothetical protein
MRLLGLWPRSLIPVKDAGTFDQLPTDQQPELAHGILLASGVYGPSTGLVRR